MGPYKHFRENMCKWAAEEELECPVIEASLTADTVRTDSSYFQIEQSELKSGRKCPILPQMDNSLSGIPSWECSNHTNDSSICLKKCQNDPNSVEGLVQLEIHTLVIFNSRGINGVLNAIRNWNLRFQTEIINKPKFEAEFYAESRTEAKISILPTDFELNRLLKKCLGGMKNFTIIKSDEKF